MFWHFELVQSIVWNSLIKTIVPQIDKNKSERKTKYYLILNFFAMVLNNIMTYIDLFLLKMDMIFIL